MMKAIVVENNWFPRGVLPGTTLMMDIGWGNGYVVIEKDHPLFGIGYDDDILDVDVHGGLTYSGTVGELHLERCEDLTEDDLGKWLIGFDTGHFDDTLEKWPKEAVQEEADRLLKQLEELKV